MLFFRRLRRISRLSSRDLSYLKDDSDSLKKVFDKIERLMKEKKPYLNCDFSISMLAAAIFCSQTMVSRAINRMSGKNFCNYVNSYRVDYAAELMRKDRRLKISEIAKMAGFNSLPPFNSSFKIQMKMCPSQYLSLLEQGRL